jgi:hypothetical protein
MSYFTTINGYGPWNTLGTRVPIEIARTGEAAPAGIGDQPRTQAQYSPTFYAISSLCLPNLPPVPAGDYPVWRAMDADPALALSAAVVRAPVLEGGKAFEAREGVPDEWVNAIQAAIEPLWSELLREALDSLSMGWKPFEVPWRRRDGLTVFADFKPLAQELTTVLVSGGAFAGLRNDRGPDNRRVDLSPLSSLVITCDGKNRDPYGRPWHENARQAWWEKQQCLLSLAKLNQKASGIQPTIYYPPAADEATNHTNENIAKTLLSKKMAGDGLAIPNAAGLLNADAAADFRNIQGLAEAALWKVEIEDFGDTGAQAASVLDQIRYHNAELSRAWHVPERTAQEGQFGTKAEAESHGNIATMMSQLVFDDICAAVSRGPIDTMLVQNYGESARGAVWVRAGRLRDVFAEADWKLIDVVLRDADTFAAVAEQVDLDAVFTRRGIPKLKGVLTLNEAFRGMAERKRERQAATVQPTGEEVGRAERRISSRVQRAMRAVR